LRELRTELNKKTMNIQDKMQEIHHKFGVTEKANYEIQLFVDGLIKKDRAEQLILHGVSNRRELLISFAKYWNDKDFGDVKIDDVEGKDPNDIDMFLQQ
jgi:hypothetical protein